MTDLTRPTPIPEAVKNIIQRSIATVKAFRELRRAGEEKASPEARTRYRKQLQNALVALDAAVVAWKPTQSATGTGDGATGGFDWTGFFRTATRGLELVRDLKNGKVDARKAQQWVEAEVTDMTDKKR